MTREEFLNLSEDDQAAYLLAADGNTSIISDLEAERDSLRTENESLKASVTESAKELKQVKETNYTLMRKFSAEPEEDPEEALYNMFK